ncbi:MAG: hypothetical protein OXG72_14265 [Acidobacteria bacterium]|nr:hypothetical protein [Acidobacteriota bacterium]
MVNCVVMVSLRQAVAIAAALLVVMALAAPGAVRHGHDPHARDGSHPDCATCHFRQLLSIETGGTPVPSAPDVVAHAVPAARPQCEQGAALGIRPTRGPPA